MKQPNKQAPAASSQFNQVTSWPCPIKLNLFLQFIGQRTDGYHLLQSYFQLVDFGDELQITPNESGEITFSCDKSELNSHNNLVVLAANKLKSLSKTPLGAQLHLIKKAPIGGGVGGGSSDCATALLVLNHLWKLNFSIDQLAQIGESLGADVPIFVRGRSAYVEGTGEKITPFNLPPAYFLVIQPNCHISTSEIFSNPLLTRNSKAITIRDLETLGLPFKGFNTMQPLVVDKNKSVSEALDWLKQHSSNARMTGSGSCVFSVFDNQQEASKIAALCDPSWQAFVTRGVNQSRLHEKLGYNAVESKA
jgi:4-diphosphocytidyl-2-C-methyl-D-erythritol kinase